MIPHNTTSFGEVRTGMNGRAGSRPLPCLPRESISAIIDFAMPFRCASSGAGGKSICSRKSNSFQEIWSISHFGGWLRGARTRTSPLISEMGQTRAS